MSGPKTHKPEPEPWDAVSCLLSSGLAWVWMAGFDQLAAERPGQEITSQTWILNGIK